MARFLALLRQRWELLAYKTQRTEEAGIFRGRDEYWTFGLRQTLDGLGKAFSIVDCIGDGNEIEHPEGFEVVLLAHDGNATRQAS